MDIQTIKSWFQRGCKPTASQFAATFDSFWHKDEDIPMTSISGLISAFLSKANVGHTHTPSDITGLETALEEATTNKMNRDGSNYQGSLSLVSPAVTSQWTVRKQDGTQVATKTDNTFYKRRRKPKVCGDERRNGGDPNAPRAFLVASPFRRENGAKADYSGTFQYPAADAAHKAPVRCDGSFGTTLPEPGTPSATLTKTGLTANTSLTANLYAGKSGLEVSGGKVVKATGEDKTSATASVSFYHRRYWGVSADAAADITALTSELSNARAKTLTFDCSGGHYFYYAYPKALGTAAWKVGGFDVSDNVLTEKTITNEYGLNVIYYVYRSKNLLTDPSVNAVIS